MAVNQLYYAKDYFEDYKTRSAKKTPRGRA